MPLDPQNSSPQEQEIGAELPSGPVNWSPKRSELLNWFRNHAVPLAEAYEGAVRLLDDRYFPGRVHFIAHAVRDIADRLVFVLDPQLTPSRVQYENEMDRIDKFWPRLQTIRETIAGTPTQDTVTIDYNLARMIDSLVAAHRERRQRSSNYELLFRYLMRNEPTRADVNQRLVSDFQRMRGWFMSLTHLRDKKAPELDEDELQTQFGKFEGMLHSFVGDFFTGTADIDEILRQANQ